MNRSFCLVVVASFVCLGLLSQDANAQWCDSCHATHVSYVTPVATFTPIHTVNYEPHCFNAPMTYTNYTPAVTYPVYTTQVLRPRYVIRPRRISQPCCY